MVYWLVSRFHATKVCFSFRAQQNCTPGDSMKMSPSTLLIQPCGANHNCIWFPSPGSLYLIVAGLNSLKYFVYRCLKKNHRPIVNERKKCAVNCWTATVCTVNCVLGKLCMCFFMCRRSPLNSWRLLRLVVRNGHFATLAKHARVGAELMNITKDQTNRGTLCLS